MWVIISAVNLFFQLLTLLIFARVMLSWFIRNPYNRYYNILVQLTEPILGPCRSLMGRFMSGSGIDFSPILALLLVNVAGSVIVRFLAGIIY